MQKRFVAILLAVYMVMSVLPIGVLAADNTRVPHAVSGGNIYFNAETGTIVDCDEGVTAADIPAKINDVAVTAIGEAAFINHTALMNVTLPESMAAIGAYAFSGCTALIGFAVDAGNQTYCAENGVLFNKSKTLLHTYPGGKTETVYQIPAGVTAIGIGAFCASRLTGVTIPESVSEIGIGAFEHSALTSVTIPAAVTEIKGSVFRECTALTSVTIPAAVTKIGSYAFYGCSGLKKVYYGGNRKQWQALSIGEENTSLTNAELYDKTHVPYAVTGGYLYFNAERGIIIDCDEVVTAAVIPAAINGVAVTGIGESAFADCTKLTSVTIPIGVTGIGYRAFYHCIALTSLMVPAGVTGIGEQAFSGCIGLTGVTLSAGVLFIGNSAFNACSGLTSVTIPAGVTGIGEQVFSGCTGLKSITLPESVTGLGNSVFEGCTALKEVNYGGTKERWRMIGATGLVGVAAVRCSDGLFGDRLPYAVTGGNLYFNIETKMIIDCDESVTAAVIPAEINSVAVTGIADNAFFGCTRLARVTLPTGVTTVGESAFSGCTALTEIAVAADNPNYCTENSVLFNKEKTLLYVYPGGKTGNYQIPGSVTAVGSHAFDLCPALTGFTVAADNQNYCAENGVLFNRDKTQLVKYPGGKAGDYQIPDGVTAIGVNAFSGCGGLTRAAIPDGVTSIGAGAFGSCGALTDVYYAGTRTQWQTFGANVSVGSAALHYDSVVGSLGDSVRWICDRAQGQLSVRGSLGGGEKLFVASYNAAGRMLSVENAKFSESMQFDDPAARVVKIFYLDRNNAPKCQNAMIELRK